MQQLQYICIIQYKETKYCNEKKRIDASYFIRSDVYLL
jgi:hypothetical protein